MRLWPACNRDFRTVTEMTQSLTAILFNICDGKTSLSLSLSLFFSLKLVGCRSRYRSSAIVFEHCQSGLGFVFLLSSFFLERCNFSRLYAYYARVMRTYTAEVEIWHWHTQRIENNNWLESTWEEEKGDFFLFLVFFSAISMFSVFKGWRKLWIYDISYLSFLYDVMHFILTKKFSPLFSLNHQEGSLCAGLFSLRRTFQWKFVFHVLCNFEGHFSITATTQTALDTIGSATTSATFTRMRSFEVVAFSEHIAE